jgi:hypothetical protein
VIPEPSVRTDSGQQTGTEHPADEAEPASSDGRRRSRWRPWVELLKRSFELELRCPRCDGSMKLKSFLTSEKSLLRLLSRLGQPAGVQGKAPARGPPYFASQVLRQRFAERVPQLDMLD